MTHQTLAAKIEEIEKEADSFKLRADDCGKMSRKTSRLISALKKCMEFLTEEELAEVENVLGK